MVGRTLRCCDLAGWLRSSRHKSLPGSRGRSPAAPLRSTPTVVSWTFWSWTFLVRVRYPSVGPSIPLRDLGQSVSGVKQAPNAKPCSIPPRWTLLHAVEAIGEMDRLWHCCPDPHSVRQTPHCAGRCYTRQWQGVDLPTDLCGTIRYTPQ